MTAAELSRLRYRPVRTVLHAPKKGVWGHLILRKKQNLYVSAIYMRENNFVYGPPMRLPESADE